MWGELAHSFQHGNSYVISMLVLAFLATIVFFERLIMLQVVYHINFSKFLGNLKKLVSAEDRDRAISYCKNVSGTSLPRISLRALEAADTDPSKVRGTIEEETIDFLPQIEKRLNLLPAVTLIIMLIGILGTIDALWTAFQSVDVLDTAKKQATLAQGIAAALNPTAMGLICGMLLLAGYHLLKGMAVSLTERVHHGVTVLANLLVPQEMAAFMPLAAGDMGASAPMMPEASFDKPAAAEAAKPAGEAANETFDDVSVEDIKDEEEII